MLGALEQSRIWNRICVLPNLIFYFWLLQEQFTKRFKLNRNMFIIYLCFLSMCMLPALAGSSDDLYALWNIADVNLNTVFTASEVDENMKVIRSGSWQITQTSSDTLSSVLTIDVNKDLLQQANSMLYSLEFLGELSESSFKQHAHLHTRPLERVMSIPSLQARALFLQQHETEVKQMNNLKKKKSEPSDAWLDAVAAAVANISAAQWTADLQELETHNRFFSTSDGSGAGLEDAQEYLFAQLAAALAPAGDRVIEVEYKDPVLGFTTQAAHNIEGGMFDP